MVEQSLEIPDDFLEIHLSSNPKFLTVLRHMIETFCREANFDSSDVQCMVFAVDEACTNVIRHSYDMDRSQKMILRADRFHDRIEFRLRDFGKRIDPKHFVKKDKDLKEPGGLGCKAMEEVMDQVEYNTNLDKGTELLMVRNLKK